MKFDEAVAAAAQIEADPLFAVVAIGRFELLADLVTAHPGAFPWGVSVVSRVDREYRAVLFDAAAVAEWLELAPRPTSKTERKPTAKSTPVATPTRSATPPVPVPSQATFAFE